MNFSSLNATAINGPARSVVLAFASLLAASSVVAAASATYHGGVSAYADSNLVARATRNVISGAQLYAEAVASSSAGRTAFVSAKADSYVGATASAVRTSFGAVVFGTAAYVAVDNHKTFVGQLATSACTATVVADATRILFGNAQSYSYASLSAFAVYLTGYSFSHIQCSATLLANANQENAAAAFATAACETACAPTAYRFVGSDVEADAFAEADGTVERRVRASALCVADLQPLPYRTTFANSTSLSNADVAVYGSVVYKSAANFSGRAYLDAVPDVTVRYAHVSPYAGCVVAVHRSVVNPLADDPNGKVFYRTNNGFVEFYSRDKLALLRRAA